jgi:hypothetical protein
MDLALRSVGRRFRDGSGVPPDVPRRRRDLSESAQIRVGSAVDLGRMT